MTARTVTRQYNAVLSSIGIEVTEFSLLAALPLGEDLSITDLADHLAFERTTLVRNLKGMAERGLIKQASDSGRAVHHVLTARGNSLLKRALPLWTQAQAAVVSRLEAENSENVLKSLSALRRATNRRS